MQVSSATPDRGLVRALGLLPAVAIILANMIGTGVFLKARVMTCNVGSPGMVLLVWLVAGVLSLTGALVYAELSAMMPKAGGEYNYIGAAYGRGWGFVYGWSRIVAIGPSTAAVAIVAVVFLNDLAGGGLPGWAMRFLPAAIILLLMALNLASVGLAGRVAISLTAIKVGLVMGIGVGAFFLADGSWSHFAMSGARGACEGVEPGARLGIAGFGAAMLGALWSYNGWNVITNLAGEVRDPSRTLPRALLVSTTIAIVLYLGVNAGYFYVLPPLEVASVPETSSVAGQVAARFLGASAAAVMAAGLMLSACGTLHTGLLAGPRLPFALARDGLCPNILTTVSRRGVPVIAVLGIGLWSMVCTLSATFDVLTDLYVFVLWIFYGMAAVALLVLRWREPDAARPYRVPGYPLVPLLFAVASAALVVNTLIATPGRALAGLGLVAAGVPLYRLLGLAAGKRNEADGR